MNILSVSTIARDEVQNIFHAHWCTITHSTIIILHSNVHPNRDGAYWVYFHGTLHRLFS